MMIDRRQALKGALGALAGYSLPGLAAARQSGVTRLGSRVALLDGGGTNVVALTAEDGLVLVDSGVPGGGQRLTENLGDLAGSARVRTVFNTHYHLACTGANAFLAASGARIVAHENARIWMATPYWVPAEGRYQEARPVAAHPTETFYQTGSTTAGSERIDYGYLIEAHTSSDIYVFFRDSNVLAVGDTVSPSLDPELDYFTGAWLGGRLDAMDRLLELSDDETQIVPGVGPPIGRPELQSERDMIATVYERVVDQVRQGDSPQDMLDAGVLDGLARTWDDPYRFIYDVHKGLYAHHNKLSNNVV